MVRPIGLEPMKPLPRQGSALPTELRTLDNFITY